MTSRRPSPLISNAGFTLLEVMIAVIVLSFGVLGVVGLQAASLQANKEARRQSAAVRMGRELADMMRGNNTIASVNNPTTNPYLLSWNWAASGGVLPTAATNDCSVTTCTTPQQVAQFEVSDWLSRLNLEVPEARVLVCFDATPYNGGTPQWSPCSGTGNVAFVKIGWVRQSTNRTASGTAAFDQATVPAIVLPVAF